MKNETETAYLREGFTEYVPELGWHPAGEMTDREFESALDKTVFDVDLFSEEEIELSHSNPLLPTPKQLIDRIARDEAGL